MCWKTQLRHGKCGHKLLSPEITHCENAPQDADGTRTACPNVETKRVYKDDGLCRLQACVLSQYEGIWKCCKCDRVEDSSPYCSYAGCQHPFCVRCTPATGTAGWDVTGRMRNVGPPERIADPDLLSRYGQFVIPRR